MSKRRRSQPRRRNFEQLESRLNLAGLVTVEFDAMTGELTMEGDGAGNEFTVEDTGVGNWTVTGLTGTIFELETAGPPDKDGNPTTVKIKAPTFSLNGVGIATINLNAGDDRVIFDGVTTGDDLIFSSGAGNDEFQMVNTSGVRGDLILNMSSGLNTVIIQNTISINGNLEITGGANDDLVTLGDIIRVEDIIMNLGGGNNTTDIIDVAGRALFEYTGGTLADVINVTNLSAPDNVVFSLGDGNNELTVNTLFTDQNVEITSSGVGNDTHDLDAIFALEDVIINLGSGNNSLMVTALDAGGSFDITGGGLADAITLMSILAVEPSFINMGSGGNSLDINGYELTDGGLQITGTTGSDDVNIFNLTLARELTVTVGNGLNNVTVDTSQTFGPMRITGGTGGDTVLLTNVSSFQSPSVALEGTITIIVGDGINDVVMDNVLCEGDCNITGGTGADTVRMISVIVDNPEVLGGDNLTIAVGNSINSVTVTNALIDGNTTITSGSGSDRITVGIYIPVNLTLPPNGDIDGDGLVDGGLVAMTGSLAIDTGAADDQVGVFLVTTGGQTSVTSGGGSDYVELYNVTSSGTVNLYSTTTILSQLGLDADILQVGYLTAPTVIMDTGFGSDLVSYYASATFGFTSINSGGDNDTVALFIMQQGGNLSITTSDGSDSVFMTNVLSDPVMGVAIFTVNSNDGLDVINIAGCTALRFFINSGTQEGPTGTTNDVDKITINNIITTELKVSAGQSTDELLIDLSVIYTSLFLDGGAGGLDRLVLQRSAVPLRGTIINWELQ